MAFLCTVRSCKSHKVKEEKLRNYLQGEIKSYLLGREKCAAERVGICPMVGDDVYAISALATSRTTLSLHFFSAFTACEYIGV